MTFNHYDDGKGTEDSHDVWRDGIHDIDGTVLIGSGKSRDAALKDYVAKLQSLASHTNSIALGTEIGAFKPEWRKMP